MRDPIYRIGSLLLPIFVLTLFSAIGLAQDSDEKPKPKNSSREISSLKSQFSKRLSELTKQYHGAEDDDAKAEVVKTRREFEVELTDQVFVLIRTRDEEGRNIRDLVWYINRIRGEARENVYRELISRYADSTRLNRLVKELGRARPTEQSENWLREIIEKSTQEQVQGNATFGLAAYLERVKEAAQFADDNEYLTNRTEEEIDAEIESLLTQCEEKFADVRMGKRTIGELAAAKLLAAQIKVGKRAPEIVGVDLDGVEFKLSDYRGKVVIIDFWGDW